MGLSMPTQVTRRGNHGRLPWAETEVRPYDGIISPVYHQKPRSLRKLAMTNKRVVIAIGAQRREAISGGNMRSRRKLVVTNKRVVIAIGAQRREAISGGNMRSLRKLAMTNFVFFASFVVQNTVNRRID